MQSRQLATPSTDVLPPSDPVEALASARIMARALADSTKAEERLRLARSFCNRLVRDWWTWITAGDEAPEGIREPIADFETTELSDPAAALAASIAKAAALLDPETAAYEIGLVYTGMLPSEHRGQLGIYYTPPALVSRLIDQATAAGVDWTKCRVLDPACGGGAFLAPVARRIVQDLNGCSPRILVENISNRLRGYEVDPFGAWLSQITLDAVLKPITSEAGKHLAQVVSVCDSLKRNPPKDRFDLVIGNPPYGRVRLEPDERARFKRGLFGHANLYGLFTDVALRHSKADGIIAYLTPTSFLAGEYFKNLRALLGKHARPVTIDFVAVRKAVFDDVLQETLLATYKRGSSGSAVTVAEIEPKPDGGLRTTTIGSFELPKKASQPWILPRRMTEARLVATFATMRSRLADWGYSVSTGPLVWNRHKEQLVDVPGVNQHPLIWAEAVTSDGRFEWRAQKKNHTLYFKVKDRDGWLVTEKPCVLLQRTTAKEQNRRLIAAALPRAFLDQHGAVVIENHLNMLRAKSARPGVSPSVLAAFLNSKAADNAFRCVSGSVAVSAYELEALPLPDVSDLQELKEIVKNKGSRDEIEDACSRLYQGKNRS